MWREVFLIFVLVVVSLAIFYAMIPLLCRPFWALVLWPHYRIVVHGREHIPHSGPGVIASNHVSWLDGFIVTVALPRRAWFMIFADYVNGPLVRQLVGQLRMIPVTAKGPKAQKAAIQAARSVLERGELFGIFPEAQLSRNGLPAPFLRGLEVILKGFDDVPVIPVAIEGMWGSKFSYSGGVFFKKKMQPWRRTVVVVFGPPVVKPVNVFEVRQAVREVGVTAYSLINNPPPAETIDPSLPSLPGLTVSTSDFKQGTVRQAGWKPGSVGQADRGVALRVVGSLGERLNPDQEGRLEALTAKVPVWTDTGHRARIDRGGFVSLVEPASQETAATNARAV